MFVMIIVSYVNTFSNALRVILMILTQFQSFKLLYILLQLIIMLKFFLTSVRGFQEDVKFTLVLSSGSVQSGGICAMVNTQYLFCYWF